MSSENNNLPQNGGYDIDAEMKKLGISVDSDNSDYNPDQTSPVKQGGGGFTDKIRSIDRKKLLTYSGIVGAILIILFISIGMMMSNGHRSKTRSSDAQVENLNNDSRSLFKASIQSAVDAQEAKGSISKSWRQATVDYSKDQDINKFKDSLLKINDRRTSYLEKIKADDNELNNTVINALNNQKEFLNKAYNVDNSADAISIYNEWNSGDKAYDEDYNTVLKKLLKDVGIKYKEKKNSEGGPTIEY